MKEKHYKAFISYSHQDEKFGKWLHKALEKYQIPKELRNDYPNLPKSLFPIFRDREELPTSSNLGEEILKGLKNSNYLIIICSINSAKSKWVNQEIIDFKVIHGENKVHAIIINGEPHAKDNDKFSDELECYPEALKYKVDRNGKLTNIATEPIAGDFRKGKDGKEHGKLKLISGLLGVKFDELNRREEKRKKRSRFIWGSVSILLIVTIIGLTLFSFIQRNNAISSEKIATKERDKAKENLKKANNNLSIYLFEKARSKYSEKKFLESYALSAKSLYLNNSLYKSYKLYYESLNKIPIKLEETIKYKGKIYISPSKDYTIQISIDSKAILINRLTKEKTTLGKNITFIKFFPHSKKFFIRIDKKLKIYDINHKSFENFKNTHEDCSSIEFNQKGNKFYIEDDKIYIYKTKDFELISSISTNSYDLLSSKIDHKVIEYQTNHSIIQSVDMKVSSNFKYMAIFEEYHTDSYGGETNDMGIVYIVNIQKEKIVAYIKSGVINDMSFDDSSKKLFLVKDNVRVELNKKCGINSTTKGLGVWDISSIYLDNKNQTIYELKENLSLSKKSYQNLFIDDNFIVAQNNYYIDLFDKKNYKLLSSSFIDCDTEYEIPSEETDIYQPIIPFDNGFITHKGNQYYIWKYTKNKLILDLEPIINKFRLYSDSEWIGIEQVFLKNNGKEIVFIGRLSNRIKPWFWSVIHVNTDLKMATQKYYSFIDIKNITFSDKDVQILFEDNSTKSYRNYSLKNSKVTVSQRTLTLLKKALKKPIFSKNNNIVFFNNILWTNVSILDKSPLSLYQKAIKETNLTAY